MQNHYNLAYREEEREVIPLCQDHNIALIPWSPIAAGFLTGKYKRGEAIPTGTRLKAIAVYYDRYYTETAFDIVEAFVDGAQRRGVTPAQLALAWVLAEPRVTCPIVGAHNLEQLEDTLGGLDIALTPEERAEIPAIPAGQWVGKDPVYDREY